MKNVDIEIPADANTVTLALNRGDGRSTLRNMLPTIHSKVELVVEDSFGPTDCDSVHMSAHCGDELAKKLKRSRVLEGGVILDLVPVVQVRDPRPDLTNGSLCLGSSSTIALFVTWPKPDEDA